MGYPRYQRENFQLVLKLVDVLGAIGARHGATSAQIALAWLLAQKPWIVPIPGSRNLSRLDENNGAVNLTLTPDDLRAIDEAMSRITVLGNRY